MSDFWDNFVNLLLIVVTAALVVGAGYLVKADMDTQQTKYGQCLTNGMQWVEGSCVK